MKSTQTQPTPTTDRQARRHERKRSHEAKVKRDRFAWLEAWADVEPVDNGLVNW